MVMKGCVTWSKGQFIVVFLIVFGRYHAAFYSVLVWWISGPPFFSCSQTNNILRNIKDINEKQLLFYKGLEGSMSGD